MNQQQPIKYRVIGALVIIFTFILAWWLLLDHDIKRFKNIKEPISEPIVIDRFDVIDIEKEAQAASAVEPETKPLKVATTKPVKKTKNTVAEVKPAKKAVKLDSKGLPEAWVLQVASFGERKNAVALQQKLYDADFPAYVKTFNVPEGKVYRVLVGPKLSKQRAAEMSKKVEKRFSLKSMIVAFKPGFEE